MTCSFSIEKFFYSTEVSRNSCMWQQSKVEYFFTPQHKTTKWKSRSSKARGREAGAAAFLDLVKQEIQYKMHEEKLEQAEEEEQQLRTLSSTQNIQQLLYCNQLPIQLLPVSFRFTEEQLGKRKFRILQQPFFPKKK